MPMGDAQTVIDGSACAATVSVMTKTYGRSDKQVDTYLGVRVEPHPGLKLFYGEGGVLLVGESDLAVVHLEQEIKGIRSVELARAEMRSGNPVIMVGYGFTRTDQEELGERYFGTNEVAEVTGEIFRVTKQGTHTYHGDSGGPCLRWPKGTKNPVLVGITRGGVAPVYSTFTSTVVSTNREWLEKVLREAKAPATVDSP
jgi:hypothetical protein